MAEIEIPNSVTNIDEGAFKNCKALTSIVFPASVGYIGKESFRDCTNLATVVFGAGVWGIDYSAFWGCSKVKEVISLNTTPPRTGAYFFAEYKKVATVKVPKSALRDYKEAENWKYFPNFEALSDEEMEQYLNLTPVTSPIATTPATGKTYDLRGMEVGDSYKGIVIQNGKKMLRK